jgi:hypothetical protein
VKNKIENETSLTECTGIIYLTLPYSIQQELLDISNYIPELVWVYGYVFAFTFFCIIFRVFEGITAEFGSKNQNSVCLVKVTVDDTVC